MFALVFISLICSLVVAAIFGGSGVAFAIAFVVIFATVGTVGAYKDWFV